MHYDKGCCDIGESYIFGNYRKEIKYTNNKNAVKYLLRGNMFNKRRSKITEVLCSQLSIKIHDIKIKYPNIDPKVIEILNALIYILYNERDDNDSIFLVMLEISLQRVRNRVVYEQVENIEEQKLLISLLNKIEHDALNELDNRSYPFIIIRSIKNYLMLNDDHCISKLRVIIHNHLLTNLDLSKGLESYLLENFYSKFESGYPLFLTSKN